LDKPGLLYRKQLFGDLPGSGRWEGEDFLTVKNQAFDDGSSCLNQRFGTEYVPFFLQVSIAG